MTGAPVAAAAWRRALVSLLAVGLAPSPGCAPDSASIAITVIPDPIAFAGFNAGHGMITWTARWSVTIRETAGRAGDVSLVETTIDAPAGMVRAVVSSDGAAIRAAQGTSHVPGRGSLTVEQSFVERDIFFFACNQYDFRVSATFVDESGHVLKASARVPEAARQRPCA